MVGSVVETCVMTIVGLTVVVGFSVVVACDVAVVVVVVGAVVVVVGSVEIEIVGRPGEVIEVGVVNVGAAVVGTVVVVDGVVAVRAVVVVRRGCSSWLGATVVLVVDSAEVDATDDVEPLEVVVRSARAERDVSSSVEGADVAGSVVELDAPSVAAMTSLWLPSFSAMTLGVAVDRGRARTTASCRATSTDMVMNTTRARRRRSSFCSSACIALRRPRSTPLDHDRTKSEAAKRADVPPLLGV